MATDGSRGHRITERGVRWTIYGLVLLVNLLQQPGRTTFDTKLELQVAPGAFLLRTLNLWNPDSALGEVQNQASGYLFPIGPFYLVGDLLHVPTWIWERAFSALLMILAFEGMRRVARAWGGLGTHAVVLAGLFYMLSPRLLSTVGALTGEALPTAVLPWTLLPLVLWLRGRMPVRRALLLSAATVPFMGGHNATETLAALALPAVLLLVNGRPWRTRAGTFGAWTAGAVVVSLWWLVPLFALRAYGSPFLDYVESARTTTDRIGWLAALRGTDHWVTFLALGDSSSWRAGLELASSPLLLVSTATAATIGLLGLTRATLRNRRALVVALALGLFVLTAGSSTAAGSLLDGPWTSLLDGVLAPFRNIHKFDPVVRLPLALGFAAAGEAVLRRWSADRIHVVGGRRSPHLVAGSVVVVLALPVVLAILPALRGDLRDSGGFTSVPDSWSEAAAYLREQPGVVRSLVVPGAGFAVQTWGRTTDEALSAFPAPPWSARTQTPLMPAGAIRWLDQVESALGAARPDPQFATVLARAGITHLVVRNDLDYANTDAPRPEVVHRLLDSSPGLLNVARFGSSRTLYPAVEIYAVADGPGDPRARLLDAAGAVTVAGGAEAVSQLVADEVLDEDRAMVRARGDDAERADVLTDTPTRIERNFGRVHDAVSQVMAADDTYRIDRAAHDYLYDDRSPRTTAEYTGISRVFASSSSGYADTLGPVLPEQGPYAAVDGSLLTSWVSAPFADPRGAWIEVRFDQPTVVGPISLTFDLANGAGVRRVAVDTDSGRRVAEVDLEGGVDGLAMEPAPTRRVRVTVLDSNKSLRPVTLQEIALGGIEVDRALVVPGTVRRDTTMSFRGTLQRPACVAFYAGLSCSADHQRLSLDSSGWVRLVDVAEGGTWEVSGSVVAAGGDAVAALTAPLDPARARVSGSSWFGGDAAALPQNAFDAQPATTWVAATADVRPVLEIRWDRPRLIERVLPQLARGAPGTLPDRIRVESDEGAQVIALGARGTGLIEPVRTTFLRLTMLRDGVTTTDEGDAAPTQPVAVSELLIDGLAGQRYHADVRSPTGAVCGFGPRIRVGEKEVLTRVRGTVGDLVSGAPMRLEACGTSADGVTLRRGRARISVENAGAFAVRDLTLRPADAAADSRTVRRASVKEWGSARRLVEVDADRDAVLTVTQALNPGWVASLAGEELVPVEVDGWMQGWQVPAGSDGVVELRYEPQRTYIVGLLGGLAVVLAALLAAAWTLLRQRPLTGPVTGPDAPERPLRRRGAAVLLVLLAAISVPAALGALVALVPGVRRRPGAAIVVAASVAVAVALTRIDDSLVAPGAADLLMAVAFGIMASAALARDRTGAGSDG